MKGAFGAALGAAQLSLAVGMAQVGMRAPAGASAYPSPMRLGGPSNTGPNAGVYMSDLKCTLDPKVNVSTFKDYEEEIRGLWQPYCAINRGIFVLTDNSTEAKNNTYSCGTLPEDWGINDIGELTGMDPREGVRVLDKYLQAVFNSSDTKIADTCDFHGLAQLTCTVNHPGVLDINRTEPWRHTPWVNMLHSRGQPNPAPLRSVNVGGLFVLEPWITPDVRPKPPVPPRSRPLCQVPLGMAPLTCAGRCICAAGRQAGHVERRRARPDHILAGARRAGHPRRPLAQLVHTGDHLHRLPGIEPAPRARTAG